MNNDNKDFDPMLSIPRTGSAVERKRSCPELHKNDIEKKYHKKNSFRS